MVDPATIAIAGKVADPIGHHIVCPIARRLCPFKNQWEYKSNLENLTTELKNLEDKKEKVESLTNAGVEPLPDVNDWLNKATNIINEVSGLISADNPEKGCCRGCTYSNLKESYQHRNNVARKLKDVARLLQEAMKCTSSWKHKSNLENLKMKVKNLEAIRESVQCSINVGEEPLPHVKFWQDKVKKVIDDDGVSGLTSEHNPEQQNKVAQMLKDVDQLLQEEAQFGRVAYQPVPEQTCLQPEIQQEFSESRMSISKEIIAALRKADVNMVGIYGMGGVGKTTLAKKVGSQAMQDKLFDKIVFVEVFKSPDLRTIQGVIADLLGLKFEENTVPGRASKLRDYLKKEKKKILIILDNIWKAIKLEEELGIPFGNDCKELKLLVTARSRGVLTQGMGSQHNFHVEALSEADAWILFKNIAGTRVDLPHLKSTAIAVTKKCGGMPLAIVTVGKALKDTEEKDEWNDALRRLNNPSSDSFEGITEEVYNSIKLSCDCLHGKLKEIFLLCSRMGRTNDASIQDLFRYGLGLGFFVDFDTVEDALCNVYASVNQLKAASLLLDAFETDPFSGHRIPTPSCESFAIHDVICDVARSIASKDRHVFTVINGHVPRSWTNENTLKSCTSITLYNIGELPKDLKLVCPKLEFLYVKLKDSYLTIPDNFFTGMSCLQVLHLIQIDLKPLPSSLSWILNLQALCLDDCKLGDVVVFGDMKKLEILSIRDSDIEMLPKEMGQLTKLRLLDLTNCRTLSVIPSKVMSSLTGIEALHMNNPSIRELEVARPNIEGSIVSIDELKHLHRLTILEMHIPDAKMFRGLICSELKRYKILIGDGIHFRGDWKPNSKISRMLRLGLDIKEDWIISQLPGIEQLELGGTVVGAINLLDDLDRNGFPQLMYLHVSWNNHCVCIVNSVSCSVLPSLESLMVEYMESLEKICNSPLGAESFLNLKTIHVRNCNKLSNIFCFFPIVRVLPNLTDLQVSCCENVEEIFAIEEQDDGNSTEVVHDIEFSQLSYLSLTNLPKLKSFCSKAKIDSPLQLASQIFSGKELNNPSWLFNEKVAIPNLQDLEVSQIHHIEQIWHGLLPTLSSSIQNLTKLSVYECDHLKELFSSSKTISEELREIERRDTILFPQLNWLEMEHLTELTRLCSGYYIEFPSLEVFKIKSCSQLKEFIFDKTVKVPSLKEMRISDMDNLKMIWHNKLTEDSFSKLESLEVTMSKKLLTVFPSNMCGRLLSLESLNVDNCYSLEQICDLQGINSDEYDHVQFMNLQELKVLGCPSLKYIFAKKGVVAKEVPAKFVFPKLISLQLNRLPNFRTFYPGKHTVEGPILKKLDLCDFGIHYTDEEGRMQQPLYLVQQVFPCLEELKLAGKELKLMMMGQAQVPECLFDKLKILHVLKYEPIVLPLGIMQRFQNLEEFLLIGNIFEQGVAGSYKEMFFYGEDQTQAAPLAKLKTLVLRNLYDLRYMWQQDSKLDLIFQNLEVLKVHMCDKLFNLMPSSASFQNLTILDVWNCSRLVTIVTSSTAKSLIKLEEMRISHCPEIREIIENEDDVTEERIIFSNLKTLELTGMHNLTSFCSCDFTLEFPSLEEVHVRKCRTMETFSWGDLTMPRLQEVMIARESFRLGPDTNLNTIMQQFHKKRNSREIDQGCSSSQHMSEGKSCVIC